MKPIKDPNTKGYWRPNEIAGLRESISFNEPPVTPEAFQQRTSDRGRFSVLVTQERRVTERYLSVKGYLPAGAMNKAPMSLKAGANQKGVLSTKLDVPGGGAYAVFETKREFALVPWREAWKRQIGRRVLFGLDGSGFLSHDHFPVTKVGNGFPHVPTACPTDLSRPPTAV